MEKIIIFDMDGVLFDSSAVIAKDMKHRYPDITEEMRKGLLVGNFHEQLAKLTIPKKVETEEESDARMTQYALDKSNVPMYAGMRDLLEFLYSNGYIIALNTSATNNNALPLLERTHITSMFDYIGTADISKSKVEKFKLIEEKFQATKENMLFITDTLGDIREADIASIPTVAVTWGSHDESYFNREPHSNLVAIVNTVPELKGFVEKY